MGSSLTQKLIFVTTTGAMAAAAIAIGCWGWFAPETVPAVKLSSGVVAGALAAAAVFIVAKEICRRNVVVERFLDSLAALQWEHLAGVDPAEAIPAPPAHHPDSDRLRRVRDILEALLALYQQAEQGRSRAEVRARRATAQCEQFREILSGLSEPILAVDQFNSLVLANQSAQRLFNLPIEDAGVKAMASLERCEQLVDLLGETRRRRTASQRSAEFEMADPEGQKRWYNASVSSLGDRGTMVEENQGAVVVLRDVSEQKAIQKRHAEFVSAVSHEMKTPLAGIKAYVELLADGDAEDEATREEFLAVINGQADRLHRLIDNLLNLARIESGVTSVHKERHSLNEILAEAIDIIRPTAEQKNIQVCSEISSMYLVAFVDRDMILQTAINLLSNAVKYTPAGGKITLRSRETETQNVFEVEDTGVGLSPEDCERVFEKFYRVKKDRNMAAGTGLGLPLAKHIVEDVHGGELRVDSQLDVGSTFRVMLPKLGPSGNG